MFSRSRWALARIANIAVFIGISCVLKASVAFRLIFIFVFMDDNNNVEQRGEATETIFTPDRPVVFHFSAFYEPVKGPSLDTNCTCWTFLYVCTYVIVEFYPFCALPCCIQLRSDRRESV